jgi:hypothetical protein
LARGSPTTENVDLTYSAVSGPCALVSGATFHAAAAGDCVVQADGAATTNFLAATAQQTVTISAANSGIMLYYPMIFSATSEK